MGRSKLTGDWSLAGRVLNEMVQTYNTIGDEPLQKCAELYLEKVKQNIENQSLDLTPLSEKYKRLKLSRGLDGRTLIATGTYLSQLRIVKVNTSISKSSLFVGASMDDIHEPSGLTMNYLGSILEYGTKDGKIPPRPHFRTSWEQIVPEVRKIWLEAARNYYSIKR